LQAEYCSTYYNACSEHLLVDGATLVEQYTAESWCQSHRIADAGYMLPDVSAVNDGDDDGGGSSQLGRLCGEPIASGLPLANPIAAQSDGRANSSLLYIVEQRGQIHAVDLDDEEHASIKWMDVSNECYYSSRAGDERGLLALTFHPNFSENQRFYLYYYTRTEQGRYVTRLSEYTTSMGADGVEVGDPTTERMLLELSQPEGNHNGGDLLFDSKKQLMLFTGDGGGAGDKHGSEGKGACFVPQFCG
jgi:hypothetical protein